MGKGCAKSSATIQTMARTLWQGMMLRVYKKNGLVKFRAGVMLMLFVNQSMAASAPGASQELAQLRDIHLPEPIGWWPMAPGWYALAFLSALGMGLLTFLLYQHYQNTCAKRHSLRLLLAYQQQYQQDGNAQLACARVSELLKRVALVYFPRNHVANLRGNAWIEFLNTTSKRVNFSQVKEEILEFPYRPNAYNNDLKLLFRCATSWINQRRGKCLK